LPLGKVWFKTNHFVNPSLLVVGNASNSPPLLGPARGAAGFQVWVKRDDMTGSTLSGNKVGEISGQTSIVWMG